MLDFPNSPTNNQLHTEQGITWIWKTSPGLWAVYSSDAAIQEFHDPTNAASWRIIGNTLECWGEIPPRGNTNAFDILFPKTFNQPPAVSLTAVTGTNAAPRYLPCNTITTTQISGARFFDDGGTARDHTASWHAIGEWDGVS